MKFFFREFVYCCGYPYRSAVTTTDQTSPPPPDDTRTTLSISWTPDERRQRSRKRGRLSASRSGSASDWRPSLNAISEENVPVESRVPRSVAGSERILKRKVAPAARDRPRYHSDEYRRAPFPAIIPAFSPTPFLF